MVLLLTMTVTVRYVQAIELGGFDVDMGTGSFEGNASDWYHDAEEESAGDENYASGDGSWSNSDSSWTTGETSEAGNDVQPETGGEDFFSSGQYEMEAFGASYNEETSEEDEISDRQAENGSVNNHTDSELEIPESQFFGFGESSKYSSHTYSNGNSNAQSISGQKAFACAVVDTNAGYFEGAGKRRRTS